MLTGQLTFFCGKMGAGKSTKSLEIARASGAVLLSEDEWLASLYPGCIQTLQDYIEYSRRLKPPIKKLVQDILLAGTDVVMDFPANTVQQRQWFRAIYSEINAPHQLIFINQSDAVCLEQIARRRESHPERAATDTEEMFASVSKHFVAPTADEGFNLVTINQA